ncbi:MAG: hypothetical protein C5B48_00510, partial [Candidatus Rokuibacteriota bacterium]
MNLDATTYGTFAEIGGGQEVARWFFSVGGAAGTVAKTISAYDMAVSNSLYGPVTRYVSRQRLEAMLEQEFVQLRDRLGPERGDSKRFFAFANTVATRSYGHPGNGRGWLGIRFQPQPHGQPSSIVIHAHLFESTAARQQEALGVLGVNLIHGAFTHHASLVDLVDSLMEELSRERIEVDMMKLAGPAFAGVDNRLLSLRLVERGLTDAAMFTADGEVVQPSEVLLQEADSRGARQLQAGDEAHARPAEPRPRSIPTRVECPRAEASRAGGNDAAEPDRDAGCRPHGLPGSSGHPGRPRFRRPDLAVRAV